MGTPFRKHDKESRDVLDKRIAYLYSEVGLTRKLISMRMSLSDSFVRDAIARTRAQKTTRKYHEKEFGLV